MKKQLISTLVFGTMLTQLGGCLFTGKSSSGSISSGSVMSGVAATGAPISGGQVEIKGSNGAIVTDTTASNGSYSANISSLDEPYLVRVIAPSGEKYITVSSHSALVEGKKVNITPLTHMIAANVFQNADGDDLFKNFTTASATFSEATLQHEKSELLQKFKDAGLVGTGGVAGNDIDLLNGDLQAGTSIGLDGLLDVIQVNTDATGGMEIKLKGGTAAIIVDKVNLPDAAVTPLLAGDITAANAQLDVIGQIRIQMNALAAAHVAKISCNGTPVDNGTACDVDTLAASLLPYFHADFKEDGRDRTAGVWSWVCRSDNDEALSKSDCMASGSMIEFENVSLKDISLISYDAGAGIALINFSLYKDGVLKGTEEMAMKLDTGDNKYKLLGNLKTFAYYVDTESLHKTDYNMTTSAATNKYNVNLKFYYKGQGTHTFDGDEVFTLISQHAIFAGPSTTMNLYLVVGPNYSNGGSCTAGLQLSTTATPYKTWNPGTGAVTHQNFATACATSMNPCNCSSGATNSYFDYDEAQKISFSPDQIAQMDKVEKITLTGSGVVGDSFSIKKPLVINANNAASYIPSFGTTVAAFCRDLTITTPFSLSVASGTLNYFNLSLGFTDAGGTNWNNENYNRRLDNDNASSLVFTPTYTIINSSSVIKNTHLYLTSRDDFDRTFVREVSCY